MKSNNLRAMVTGFAFTVLGVALAVTIPNAFTSGQVVSSAQVNANFTALKTAVDALESKKSITGFRYEVTLATKVIGEESLEAFINNAATDGKPGAIITLQQLADNSPSVDPANFTVRYSAVDSKWVIARLGGLKIPTGTKFFITVIQ